MIVTTTSTLQGYKIEKYLGVVTGETIIGANIVRDFMANITDIIGGGTSAYEESLHEAKETAMREMTDIAEAMGANAVIGVDLDFENIGQHGGMLMVTATGTAIICSPESG